MRGSRPISVDGRFVGVAVAREADWMFLATDPGLEDLEGMAFPDPAEAARVARLVVLRSRGRVTA
ncbi:hypothetical protein D9599_18590 [Roseomonas sp. KE2513]|uniref:hypothetical protein n=1 Tax=Roseomonadaceae TaxID=3385906 RepID=UPI0005C185B3|nr:MULTISPECIES: hypothetical protein [Roseomonas]MBI0537570.1 hypothetical protein [Roseomonas sp. KE2513]